MYVYYFVYIIYYILCIILYIVLYLTRHNIFKLLFDSMSQKCDVYFRIAIS